VPTPQSELVAQAYEDEWRRQAETQEVTVPRPRRAARVSPKSGQWGISST
jgi:hypothetical protein